MEKEVKVNSGYDSLDKLLDLLKKESTYKCSKEYDIWEMRTDRNGQMEQCILVVKSKMHAIKIFFINESTVKLSHVIPSKTMNAYFGKNVEARKNIAEIISGFIKQAFLSGSQKKAFQELEQKISAIIT